MGKQKPGNRRPKGNPSGKGLPSRKKDPDPIENIIEGMARIACSQETIATIVGLTVDTLKNRFSDAIERGRANMALTLLQKQFKVGVDKENVTMLIHLGKNYCNQSDKMETKSTGSMDLRTLGEPLLEAGKAAFNAVIEAAEKATPQAVES